MKTFVALLLALLLPVQSFATECSSPVSLLNEGDKAPCRGYLFDPSKELEARTNTQNLLLDEQEITALNGMLDKLKKQLADDQSIIDDRTQQAELWRNRAIESTKALTAETDSRQTRDLLCVGAGILLTILSAWAYKQVNTAR